MKAVSSVWAQAFYKRNFLFFFLAISLLALIFRPPTLLISPIFILPMLGDNIFFLAVSGLWTLYLIKCAWESFQTIHHPENQFLYLLVSLPGNQFFRLIVWQFVLIGAPALFYLSVIAVYSLIAGSWHWAILVLWMGTWIISVSLWLAYELRHPREVRIRPGWQKWLEKRFSDSLTYISLASLWQSYRRQVFIFKVIVWGLLALTLWGQPMIPKALALIFWSMGCLQGILAHRIRQSEDEAIFIFRNLPIARYKRWLAYFSGACLLFLPEMIIWFSFSYDTQGLFQAISCGLGAVGVHMIGISLLYYQPYPIPDFLNRLFVILIVGFVLILFGLPLWGLAILCLLFSVWVFGEEYYRWNGWMKP